MSNKWKNSKRIFYRIVVSQPQTHQYNHAFFLCQDRFVFLISNALSISNIYPIYRNNHNHFWVLTAEKKKGHCIMWVVLKTAWVFDVVFLLLIWVHPIAKREWEENEFDVNWTERTKFYFTITAHTTESFLFRFLSLLLYIVTFLCVV